MIGVTAAPIAGRVPVAWVVAGASITILDGFDAFSLSLTAPRITTELHIATASLGIIFASAMAGMIVGAAAGGALADKVGRTRVLISSLVLFGVAALALPLASHIAAVVLNRLVAGLGLGAAVPIAVALLNGAGAKPPSELVVALVVAGIPAGGSLAALFNYLFVPVLGWHSIFFLGGVLPLPVALLAWRVFRTQEAEPPIARRGTQPGITRLFREGRALRTSTAAAMFFFGYMTTAIIASWLPTVLAHRAASRMMIAATFGAIQVGSVLGVLAFGLVASRTKARSLLPIAWAAAGVCMLAAASIGRGNAGIALLAIAAYAIGAGGQALAMALANDMHRQRRLESTSVGFMTAVGRLGQACSLAVSGEIIALSGRETLVFGMAGVFTCIAALFAFVAVGPLRSPTADAASGPMNTPSLERIS